MAFWSPFACNTVRHVGKGLQSSSPSYFLIDISPFKPSGAAPGQLSLTWWSENVSLAVCSYLHAFFPLLASCYCGLSAGWVAVDMMGKVLTVPTFHCDMNTSDFQREWELTMGIHSCQLQGCEAWSFLLTDAFHVIFAICYFQHCSCAHVGLSIARAQDFHAWLSIALDCLQK